MGRRVNEGRLFSIGLDAVSFTATPNYILFNSNGAYKTRGTACRVHAHFYTVHTSIVLSIIHSYVFLGFFPDLRSGSTVGLWHFSHSLIIYRDY